MKASKDAARAGQKGRLRIVLFVLSILCALGCLYMMLDFQNSSDAKLSGELIIGQVDSVSYEYQDSPFIGFLFEYFGVLMYLIPPLIIFLGYHLFLQKIDIWRVDFYRLSLRILGFNFSVIGFAALLSRFSDLGTTGAGGLLGDMLNMFSNYTLPSFLGVVLFIVIAYCGVSFFFARSPFFFFDKVGGTFFNLLPDRGNKKEPEQEQKTTKTTSGSRAKKSKGLFSLKSKAKDQLNRTEPSGYDLNPLDQTNGLDPLANNFNAQMSMADNAAVASANALAQDQADNGLNPNLASTMEQNGQNQEAFANNFEQNVNEANGAVNNANAENQEANGFTQAQFDGQSPENNGFEQDNAVNNVFNAKPTEQEGTSNFFASMQQDPALYNQFAQQGSLDIPNTVAPTPVNAYDLMPKQSELNIESNASNANGIGLQAPEYNDFQENQNNFDANIPSFGHGLADQLDQGWSHEANNSVAQAPNAGADTATNTLEQNNLNQEANANNANAFNNTQMPIGNQDPEAMGTNENAQVALDQNNIQNLQQFNQEPVVTENQAQSNNNVASNLEQAQAVDPNQTPYISNHENMDYAQGNAEFNPSLNEQNQEFVQNNQAQFTNTQMNNMPEYVAQDEPSVPGVQDLVNEQVNVNQLNDPNSGAQQFAQNEANVNPVNQAMVNQAVNNVAEQAQAVVADPTQAVMGSAPEYAQVANNVVGQNQALATNQVPEQDPVNANQFAQEQVATQNQYGSQVAQAEPMGVNQEQADFASSQSQVSEQAPANVNQFAQAQVNLASAPSSDNFVPDNNVAQAQNASNLDNVASNGVNQAEYTPENRAQLNDNLDQATQVVPGVQEQVNLTQNEIEPKAPINPVNVDPNLVASVAGIASVASVANESNLNGLAPKANVKDSQVTAPKQSFAQEQKEDKAQDSVKPEPTQEQEQANTKSQEQVASPSSAEIAANARINELESKLSALESRLAQQVSAQANNLVGSAEQNNAKVVEPVAQEANLVSNSGAMVATEQSVENRVEGLNNPLNQEAVDPSFNNGTQEPYTNNDILDNSADDFDDLEEEEEKPLYAGTYAQKLIDQENRAKRRALARANRLKQEGKDLTEEDLAPKYITPGVQAKEQAKAKTESNNTAEQNAQAEASARPSTIIRDTRKEDFERQEKERQERLERERQEQIEKERLAAEQEQAQENEPNRVSTIITKYVAPVAEDKNLANQDLGNLSSYEDEIVAMDREFASSEVSPMPSLSHNVEEGSENSSNQDNAVSTIVTRGSGAKLDPDSNKEDLRNKISQMIKNLESKEQNATELSAEDFERLAKEFAQYSKDHNLDYDESESDNADTGAESSDKSTQSTVITKDYSNNLNANYKNAMSSGSLANANQNYSRQISTNITRGSGEPQKNMYKSEHTSTAIIRTPTVSATSEQNNNHNSLEDDHSFYKYAVTRSNIENSSRLNNPVEVDMFDSTLDQAFDMTNLRDNSALDASQKEHEEQSKELDPDTIRSSNFSFSSMAREKGVFEQSYDVDQQEEKADHVSCFEDNVEPVAKTTDLSQEQNVEQENTQASSNNDVNPSNQNLYESGYDDGFVDQAELEREIAAHRLNAQDQEQGFIAGPSENIDLNHYLAMDDDEQEEEEENDDNIISFPDLATKSPNFGSGDLNSIFIPDEHDEEVEAKSERSAPKTSRSQKKSEQNKAPSDNQGMVNPMANMPNAVQYMQMPNGQYVPVLPNGMPMYQQMPNMSQMVLGPNSQYVPVVPNAMQYMQMPNGQYVPVMQNNMPMYQQMPGMTQMGQMPNGMQNQNANAYGMPMNQMQNNGSNANNAQVNDLNKANASQQGTNRASTPAKVETNNSANTKANAQSSNAQVVTPKVEQTNVATPAVAGVNSGNNNYDQSRHTVGEHGVQANGLPTAGNNFIGAHNSSSSNLPSYMAGVSQGLPSFDVKRSMSLCTVPRRAYNDWRPSLDLLARSHDHVENSEEDLNKTAERINEVLHSFGIKASVADYLTGPVITRFDLDLAPGVKSTAISSIETELCRNLMVQNVRVVPIIDGSSYVGLEVPNRERQFITLGDMAQSREFLDTDDSLPMCLGASVVGKPVVKDLADSPHLLVAGTTGSGKSAGLNTMLISLLLKRSPAELRLILVDPKQLEFSIYKDLPHLITPVITDVAEKTPIALRWCVDEMERRFKLMSMLGVRKLDEYNQLIRSEKQKGNSIADPLWTADMGPIAQSLEPLPWIVVVVEEFADLMAQSTRKKDKENTPDSLIGRLSAKSRAAGIHLVLVTQTPRSEVVTGMIKANFPSRVAFTVQNRLDSTIVLDEKGAECLLGNGDMLYKFTGSSTSTRAHGAFTSNADVMAVVNAWKEYAGAPEYLDDVVAVPVEETKEESSDTPEQKLDSKFDDAVVFVRAYMAKKNKVPTVTELQNELGTGFPRAKKIFSQLLKEHIIEE